MSLRTALILPALTITLSAQQASTPNLTATQRKEVVETLAKELKAKYTFPEVGEKVAKALREKAARDGFSAAGTPEAFAEALSKDLRTLGQDLHFRVGFDPDFKPGPESENRPPTKEEAAQMRQEMLQVGFGISKIERLSGNVGYLELRGFGPTQAVAQAYTAAIALLDGTEALILDLRRNGGGEPESVAYLLSHFFPEGDIRLLNSIYDRHKNTTRQYWTTTVGTHYSRPIYVLISPRTASGGEECAYDLQTQKRATLVGEISAGAANPGDDFSLGQYFVAFIPTGRAINPITHTNWEHLGVKPHVAVPAADALKVAHAAILKDLMAQEKNPEQRGELAMILARVEKDEVKTPNYIRR